MYWIKKLNTCTNAKDSNGYNVTIGGEGGVSWNSQAIVQFTIDGKYVDEYVSGSHASCVTKIRRKGITDCANGRIKTYGGYRWMLKQNWDGKNLEPYIKPQHQTRQIIQLDLNGNYIQGFDSLKDASEKTNTPRTSISVSLKKHSRANNYIWVYKNDYKPNNDYAYKGHKIGKGIVQLDDNFNLIAFYNNCSEGARAIGEDTKVHKLIHKSLNNGNRCRGYYWKRYEDYINMKHDNTEVSN